MVSRVEDLAEHRPWLLSLIRLWVGEWDLAEDLTQDVLLQAAAALGRFRGEAALRTWLYRIAKNHVMNFRLWQGRQCRSFPREGVPEDGAALGGEALEQLPDGSLDPEHAYLNTELGAAVQSALGALRPDWREVVTLCDLDGLSYAEIAASTGLSRHAVRACLFRARQSLRRRLGPYLSAE